MTFVVHTQVLENYGAHCEDGKFSSGNAYWKFKGGNTYIVSDVEREQDAVAFVMAAFCENNVGWKEYPSSNTTVDEWLQTLEEDDKSYRDFQKEMALNVSPHNGKTVKKGFSS
tara:strand:+ start:14277 stop:14615 length:339 start_codon:yes stop_codon:yes gene_type:complete